MGVNIVIDSKFDDKGIKDAQRQLQNMAGQAAKRVAQVGAAVAAAGAVAAGKLAVDAVNAASDFEESINAVNVAFGDASEAVLEIGENAARSMGLSREEFNSAAVRFSAFAERVVGEGGDVAGFIGDVSTRAADFASVFNIEVSEALQVFQSGLAGEAEPLKRFGINLLQSEVAAFAMANGIAESSASMTEAQKVQARYGLLLEQTAKTAGDFANTSDGLANSQRILRAELSNLQVEIGSALLPAAKNLVSTFATALLPRLEDFSAWLQSPEGIDAVENFGNQIENVTNFLLDFGGFIVDNLGTIVGLGVAIAGVTAAVKLYGVAVQIATVKQAGLNATIALNPFGLLATAIAAVTVALGFGAAALLNYNESAQETEEVNNQFHDGLQRLHDDIEELNILLSEGKITQDQYNEGIREYERRLREARGAQQEFLGFTDAQKEASFAARDASIALRHATTDYGNAADTATGASGRSAEALEDVAIKAAEAMLGVSQLSMAEQARAIQAEEIARIQLYGGQAEEARSFTEIMNTLTARMKFQTQAAVENDLAIEEIGRSLGLVVPGADSASSSVDNLTNSYDGLASSTLRAADAVKELSFQEQIRSGQVRVQTPGGEVVTGAGFGTSAELSGIEATLAERFGTQAVDRILERTLGGTSAEIRNTLSGGTTLVNPETNRRVSGNIQGARLDELIAQGFTEVGKIAVDADDLENAIRDVSNDVLAGNIPGLAKGGIVTKPTMSFIGEAGPEAVIPLSKLNRMGGGDTYNIYVNASNRTGGAQAGEEVVNALKTYQTTNGDFNRALTGFGA